MTTPASRVYTPGITIEAVAITIEAGDPHECLSSFGVCTDKRYEGTQCKVLFGVSVVHLRNTSLKYFKFIDHRTKEAIQIFWLVWTGNNSKQQHIFLLVPLVDWQIVVDQKQRPNMEG